MYTVLLCGGEQYLIGLFVLVLGVYWSFYLFLGLRERS